LVREHADPMRSKSVRLDAPPASGGPEPAWEAGEPLALPSPAADVAVWMCGLVLPRAQVDALAATLSSAEMARAERFSRDDLRDRYIVGRATLRVLLGRRLGRPPAAVVLERGARGRPFAADANGLDFNVSHTEGVALIGMTVGVRIGVDVEHAARALNVEGIARKFMAPAEQRELAELEPDARRRALLRLWTCKEAMSKATGDALSAPFRWLEVETGPALRLADGPPPYGPAAWRLLPVAMPGGFLGTVALWRQG
jgi:4'-phosphopantetheinyl transferase